MVNVTQPFPQFGTPFTDPQTGIITKPWLNLLRALFTRTGGSQGTAAGTVTSVGTGTGLTGGPITDSGTISLADIGAKTLLANATAGSAAPVPESTSVVLDFIGATEGDVLARGASAWQAVAPGTAGEILVTGGAGALPSWQRPFGTPALGVSAAGTNQGTATALTANVNQVTTVGAGQGVALPTPVPGAEPIVVSNQGAHTLSVYPPTGVEIDALGVNVAYSLADPKMQIFWPISTTLYYSTQLG